MSGLPSGGKTPDGKTPDGKTPGDAIEAAGLDLWPMDRTRRGPSESNAL